MRSPDLSAVTAALTKAEVAQGEREVKQRCGVFQRPLPSTKKHLCRHGVCVCVCVEMM